MRAVRLHKIGEQFQVDQVPDPAPPPGGAVVRLEAAALNHRDEYIRVGLYAKIQLPAVLGSDGAGVVESVAAGVDTSWIGRKVMVNPCDGWGPNPRAQDTKTFLIRGMPKQGTFAEKIALPLDRLEPMPEHLSWPEAAALPLGGLTAYRALVTRGELQKGEHVLVTGIGGGVATVALLLAQALGAQVSVTSGSEEKLQRARSMGAVAAVSYKEKGWEKQLVEMVGRPPSLIIDSAGGPDFAALISAVAPGGRIVSYGATRGPVEKLEMTRVFFKQIDLRGTTMGTDDEFRAMLQLVARERLRPIVDHVYPLSQAAEADRRLAQSEQMGKIVLNCRA
ncbi:MAG TPA: zinc-binding dehydrogenase [Myxococcales bacterium]|nr:zinc-binding dehydrogenase [Myxococcales bacterium]